MSGGSSSGGAKQSLTQPPMAGGGAGGVPGGGAAYLFPLPQDYEVAMQRKLGMTTKMRHKFKQVSECVRAGEGVTCHT